MKVQVLIAVSSQCVMAVTYTCIAVILYPILRRYNESAAIGYLGFRIIGAAFLYVGIVTLLSLLFISESFAAAGQPGSSYFHTIGELLRVGRDWFNHIGMILPWSLGGLMLYYAFLQMKLIPNWLSVWSLLSSSLTLIATLLLIVDAIKVVTVVYLVLNGPAVLFEIALAVFLFTRGLRPIDVQLKEE
jgi:hypothetical protein